MYRLPPHVSGTDVQEEFSVHIATNEQGLRDRDYSTVRPAGVVRRLLIRRLKIRYEHRADIHLAFLQLGFALISLAFLG